VDPGLGFVDPGLGFVDPGLDEFCRRENLFLFVGGSNSGLSSLYKVDILKKLSRPNVYYNVCNQANAAF
jgi:hypothetical protein